MTYAPDEEKLVRFSGLLNGHIDEFPWKLDGAIAHVTTEPLEGSPETPAWYLPAKGDVYINLSAVYYDDDAEYRLACSSMNRDKFPAVIMGMLAHETAHSRWSDWMTDFPMKPSILQVATLFEELRIEKRASDWRSGRRDRDTIVPSTWLRGCFTWLLKKMTAQPLSTQPLALGHTWALIVGRYVAGIALLEEVQPIDMAVRTALGDDTVDMMREILDEAVQTEDPQNRLPGLAKEWLELLHADGDECPQWSLFLHAGEPQPEDEGSSEMGEVVAAAIEQVAEAVDETGAALPVEPALSNPMEMAPKVFGGHGKGRGSFTRNWKTREPTPALRAEAARLSRTLETLSLPSVTLTHIPSEIPPGRLRGREAVRQSAERSMAMMTTATPWERTKRRKALTRPVIVGVMTDVSGSMGWAQKFVADFAWVMAKAGTRVGARCAAATFGDTAEMVVRPGEVPQLVRERDSDGGCEEFDLAAAAIEGVLHLSVPTNAAKVLFIVSDGHLVNEYEPQKAARWLERWTKGGTLVVWIGCERWEELAGRVRKPGKAVRVPIGMTGRRDTDKIMRDMEKVVIAAARGMQ